MADQTPSNLADARGVTTSEFWVTVLLALGGVLQDLSGNSNVYLSVAGVVFGFAYVVGRFWLKAHRSAQLSEVESLRKELNEVYALLDRDHR